MSQIQFKTFNVKVYKRSEIKGKTCQNKSDALKTFMNEVDKLLLAVEINNPIKTINNLVLSIKNALNNNERDLDTIDDVVVIPDDLTKSVEYLCGNDGYFSCTHQEFTRGTISMLNYLWHKYRDASQKNTDPNYTEFIAWLNQDEYKFPQKIHSSKSEEYFNSIVVVDYADTYQALFFDNKNGYADADTIRLSKKNTPKTQINASQEEKNNYATLNKPIAQNKESNADAQSTSKLLQGETLGVSLGDKGPGAKNYDRLKIAITSKLKIIDNADKRGKAFNRIDKMLDNQLLDFWIKIESATKDTKLTSQIFISNLNKVLIPNEIMYEIKKSFKNKNNQCTDDEKYLSDSYNKTVDMNSLNKDVKKLLTRSGETNYKKEMEQAIDCDMHRHFVTLINPNMEAYFPVLTRVLTEFQVLESRNHFSSIPPKFEKELLIPEPETLESIFALIRTATATATATASEIPKLSAVLESLTLSLTKKEKNLLLSISQTIFNCVNVFYPEKFNFTNSQGHNINDIIFLHDKNVDIPPKKFFLIECTDEYFKVETYFPQQAVSAFDVGKEAYEAYKVTLCYQYTVFTNLVTSQQESVYKTIKLNKVTIYPGWPREPEKALSL